jgi:hypothetical protein
LCYRLTEKFVYLVFELTILSLLSEGLFQYAKKRTKNVNRQNSPLNCHTEWRIVKLLTNVENALTVDNVNVMEMNGQFQTQGNFLKWSIIFILSKNGT